MNKDIYLHFSADINPVLLVSYTKYRGKILTELPSSAAR